MSTLNIGISHLFFSGVISMKPKYDLFAKLLEQCGCRAAEVARGTGIHPTVFSDWKSGKSAPKQDKIKKIADFFCVDWNDFYDTEDAVEPHYYIDNATAEKAQELLQNRDLRILFDAARDSKPEDLQMAADLLMRLKETNKDG